MLGGVCLKSKNHIPNPKNTWNENEYYLLEG